MENKKYSNVKLIPRDISEQLGKLPPQAIDMEEAVLGALLLESPSLAIVSPFLKATHFYTEKHQEIYAAILALAAASDPIDMRTVSAQLKKNGRLELVGGMYHIAQLTSKVSSAANIEYHARVIVEMSIKRQLIEFASRIHHDAYEDTTDCFELLDRSVNDLSFFKENNTFSNTETNIKALWLDSLVTEEPPDNPPLICIGDAPVATAGNHSLIIGKKKSRKTLYVVWLLSQYIKYHPDKYNSVLIFDTEQGRKHVYRLRHKLHLMTGSIVPAFYLRGQSPKERRDFIEHTVQYWADRPTIIVIDGIRDLMSNINDPDETTEVIVWLEKLTLKHNVHVINVLHQNKTDQNARGHIGSELLNKAEVTTELIRDEGTNTTIVRCESSREKPFNDFSFTHGENDLPEVTGVPLPDGPLPLDEKMTRLIFAFEDGLLHYKEAIKNIKDNFAVGENKAGQILAEAIRNGWVLKSGPNRSINTTYKLLVSTAGVPLKPLPKTPSPITDTPPPELPF